MSLTISLLGFGAIGSEVLRHLTPELESGAVQVAGIVVRDAANRPAPLRGTYLPVDAAIAAADLVIECAGVAVAREAGPRVVAAGRTLLLASMGALADPQTADALSAGPGRVVFTSGAIGGLDLIRAIAQAGAIDELSITTTKGGASLTQPWMDEATAKRLRGLTEPEVIFDGSPVEAIAKFPQNVNIAVALGVAARGLGPIADGLARVRVRIVAAPGTTSSVHVIEADGATGRYRFEFVNRPSPANPRSSALTAQSLAADVRELLARPPGPGARDG